MARHLNQVDQEVKAKPIEAASSNQHHSHDHETALKSEADGEHKHSDSTHSAIGEYIDRSFSYCSDFSISTYKSGVTLVLGFVFMLIIDNCGSRIIHHHGSQGFSFLLFCYAPTRTFSCHFH
jgi:hypothetical protein